MTKKFHESPICMTIFRPSNRYILFLNSFRSSYQHYSIKYIGGISFGFSLDSNELFMTELVKARERLSHFKRDYILQQQPEERSTWKPNTKLHYWTSWLECECVRVWFFFFSSVCRVIGSLCRTFAIYRKTHTAREKTLLFRKSIYYVFLLMLCAIIVEHIGLKVNKIARSGKIDCSTVILKWFGECVWNGEKRKCLVMCNETWPNRIIRI